MRRNERSGSRGRQTSQGLVERIALLRRDGRWCSRCVPEGMVERVASVLAFDEAHEQARGPAVGYDDLGLARVPVPLGRDRVINVRASVHLYKHDGLLSRFAYRICGEVRSRHLTHEECVSWSGIAPV